MDVAPASNAIPQAEVHAEDVARHAALPAPIPSGTTAEKDTVELSAEAVTIVMSTDGVAANIEVIDTGNGVGRALLNHRR
jgi:hypothetical protein